MRLAVVISVSFMGVAHAQTVRSVETNVSEGRACLPMADGTTLLGTGGGLARVAANGDVMRVWTASDGLPGTRIDAVALAGDELWIGTDAGAARLHKDLGIARVIAGPSVRDIARWNGTTYLATWGGGVRAVTDAGAEPLAARGRTVGAKLQASSLAVAGGALYVGTPGGLFRVADGALEPVLSGKAIASLHGDGDRLWIATSDGLYVREGSRDLLVGNGDFRRVTALDGAIVAASVGEGLVRVDRGRVVPLTGRPAAPMMQALAARGAAACAGALDGAWLADKGVWKRVAHRAGPPSNDISAVAVDGDRLWVGTFDKGLAVREGGGRTDSGREGGVGRADSGREGGVGRADSGREGGVGRADSGREGGVGRADSGQWRTITHPSLDRRINALHVERRPGGVSRVWIATASGLHSFEGAVATRMSSADGLPTRSILSVAGLRDGRIVAGTSQGAAILAAGRPQRLGPKGVAVGNVWAIAEDAEGRVWLGTTTGLHRGIPGDDASWQRFSIATGHLRDDWVTALAVRDRAIYAGTYHGGVVRFDADGKSEQLGDGWINPGGLSFDGGKLLVSTMDGLFVDGTTRIAGLPGVDVTTATRVGPSLIVTTRRGLVELR